MQTAHYSRFLIFAAWDTSPLGSPDGLDAFVTSATVAKDLPAILLH